MAVEATLGEFLRSRREQILPSDVGLPIGERRRVSGLRREEVAMLAGISAEYYLRLEQGRDAHPSDQVLDSIATALRLDPKATAQLHGLVQGSLKRQRQPRAGVSTSVKQLIDNWTTTPAYVHGPSVTVLAANPLAIALSPFFTPGANPLHALFLAPEMRDFYRNWDDVTARAVATLRLSPLVDPALVSLIGELSIGSAEFRALWAAPSEVVGNLTQVFHPVVGPLDLQVEPLTLSGVEQVLMTYHAEPGSETEERLRMLAVFIG